MNSGGIYDPATDVWTPTGGTGNPGARYGHTAIWTGSQMILWGGYYHITGLPTFSLNSGDTYANPTVLPPPAALSRLLHGDALPAG